MASERGRTAALVTDIQGYSIHDGPGIRTVVFMKGCGLECRWCSNPECISSQPEIGFIRSLCTRCGECDQVCPDGAPSWEDGEFPRIDRDLCSGCAVCASACSRGALVLYGRSMTVAEVFDAVQRDAMFYKPSSGGVTLSGGEPLLQPRFARALLEKCHEAGIHTCIETSGHAAESALREVLPHTDYVLYDLKLLDSERHRRYTGTSNSRILANARVVVESGVATLFRMPLIPGVNDDPQNIRDTAAFISALGGDVAALQLMAYHRLAMGKYESLDRPYTLADLQAHQPDEVERVRQLYAENGVRCTVSQ